MNGLTTIEMWIVVSVILFFIILIIIAVFLTRKVKGGELPKGDMNLYIPHIDFLMRVRGWETKVNPYKGKITVSKDSIIATDIYLRQLPNGKIEILHSTNAGLIGWVLVVVLILFAWIVGLILAIYLHVSSRKFANQEAIPMIRYYPLGAVPPPVQPQIYPCLSCGRPLRYINEHKRWYCYTCRKYV